MCHQEPSRDSPSDHAGAWDFDYHVTTTTTPQSTELPSNQCELDSNLVANADTDIIYDVSMGFDRYCHYAPIVVNPNIVCNNSIRVPHPINLLGSQLNVDGWNNELYYENDRNLYDYIDYGVKNGFLIVDSDADIPTYERFNYKSATSGKAFGFIDNLIKSKLRENKLMLVEEKPHCVHSIGAVPKKGGKSWRPITDCKRPIGSSINMYMSSTFKEFCYASVDQVINMIEPGNFMASIDIAAAYRSIMVHPSHWQFQGLAWEFDGETKYLVDKHICFGLRCAPYIFTQISNFILRCLKRRGFSRCIVYLDDFLVFGTTREECEKAQLTLIEILRSLGLYLSWEKCNSPTQVITYLGVTFDALNMSVSIPPEKLEKLHRELEFFRFKKRATRKQIQRLCGVLSHCSKVVKGGRTFSRRVMDLLKGIPDDKKRIVLSKDFKHDIQWWQAYADFFNGRNLMIQHNFGQGPNFFTDSCLRGYGFWSGADWQAGYFDSLNSPGIQSLDHSHDHWVNVHIEDVQQSNNINVLELVPVWLCLKRNAKKWSNLHVICYTDNSSVRSMVNKGCSTNHYCMALIRDIFWICVEHNVHLTSRHIPGKENIIADLLSRIFVNDDVAVIGDYPLCCSDRVMQGGFDSFG